MVQDFKSNLPKTAGLTLPLHEGKDVPLAHRPLDVSNDATIRIVEELDSNLSGVTSVASTAHHLVNLGKLGVSRSILHFAEAHDNSDIQDRYKNKTVRNHASTVIIFKRA